jgi:hypothetical protein
MALKPVVIGRAPPVLVLMRYLDGLQIAKPLLVDSLGKRIVAILLVVGHARHARRGEHVGERRDE